MLNTIASYHAHIYFDQSSRAAAETVRAQIGERFSVRLGRWHEVPVGPHPQAMYQIAFLPALFSTLVPWLMLNRRGLTILVHPNTGAPKADHLINPIWFGEVLTMNAASLPETENVSHMETEPNTTPTVDMITRHDHTTSSHGLITSIGLIA